MAGFVRVIWVSREAVYFCERDWTGQITLKLLGKIDLSRKSIYARASYFRTSRTEPHGRLLDFWANRHPGGALKNIGYAQGA
jgi:hypothetical protein